MKARRTRRRLFNVFAFGCLAFAIYLIAFSKEDNTQQTGQAAHSVASNKAQGSH